MLLKINFEKDTPIYLQIKIEIIKGIAKGELLEGESLPSVRQLAADIGINMHTVNKTYNILRNEGFVTIDRRKGAVIAKIDKLLNEKYYNELEGNLSSIIGEAVCRGMSSEEFMNCCKKEFKQYKEGRDNDR